MPSWRSRRMTRSPPPTPPMPRSPTATSRRRCMACRWRTRTCITRPARSSPAARRSARTSSPTTTSTALQRLKDAGTVRLGSLQMVEFAYGPTGHNPHYGAVRNPWNVDHITGGSSSGSGSAVAARLTFAALGSDTGGSIRMPAHFCGVTGLKTTVGRISRAGAMPLSQSLDTVGPLAHTRGRLRAAARADGGRRSRGSHRIDAAGAGLHGRDHRLAQRPQDRRADRLLRRRSRCRSRARARRDDHDPEERGRRDRQGRTAGPTPAHRRLPDGARGRSRRVPQALDDRAAAGLRRAGLDAAAERARDSRRDLSRGDALARSGAGRVSRGGRRHRCRDRAGARRCRRRPSPKAMSATAPTPRP